MIRKITIDGFEYLIEGEVIGLICERKNSFIVSLNPCVSKSDILKQKTKSLESPLTIPKGVL
jgi:hypothetical protein